MSQVELDWQIQVGKNSSFSRQLIGFQTSVDSTSLGSFKTCPRKYFYEIILGLISLEEQVDLEFGILYHSALEHYDHSRAGGAEHADALDRAVDFTLRATWNSQLQRPCAWGDSNKNRFTLLRTVVDYLDRFGPSDADTLKTLRLNNGKPAVELSFCFFSGFSSRRTGEQIDFCGHLDKLAEMAGEHYVVDRKTTRHTINAHWFKQFTPHNQFSLYILAGQVAFRQRTVGLVVDGAQIAVGFSRFERGLVQRSEEQLKEWYRDAGWQIRLMEECASEGYWPQNDQSCDRYGGCKFRGLCSRSPQQREQWIGQEYRQRVWDPLQRRGDI